MQKIIWLKKVSDELVSHCQCGDGRIGFPVQMDCPWCGCGWLFSCVKCRKAFTFAEGVEINASWEEMARLDIANGGWKTESDEEAAAWIEGMKVVLRGVQPGKQYVILDGRVMERTAGKLKFDGWYARHELDGAPQEQALKDPKVVETMLSNQQYWRSRELPDRER